MAKESLQFIKSPEKHKRGYEVEFAMDQRCAIEINREKKGLVVVSHKFTEDGDYHDVELEQPVSGQAAVNFVLDSEIYQDGVTIYWKIYSAEQPTSAYKITGD